MTEKRTETSGHFIGGSGADPGWLSDLSVSHQKRCFLYGSYERKPGTLQTVSFWNRHHGTRYFSYDLVRWEDLFVYRLRVYFDFYRNCDPLRRLKRHRTTMGGYTAYAVYRSFPEYSESASGDPSPGDPWKAKCTFRFAGHRCYQLGQHCKSSPHRSTSDPGQ